jgi:hypothetical protein
MKEIIVAADPFQAQRFEPSLRQKFLELTAGIFAIRTLLMLVAALATQRSFLEIPWCTEFSKCQREYFLYEFIEGRVGSKCAAFCRRKNSENGSRGNHVD